MHIRDATRADLPAIHAINQAEIPAVSDIDEAMVEWFFEVAVYLRVAEIGGEIAGFLLGLPPGLPYASENYRWFSERYPDFCYIDRLAVAPGFRRRGVARALYGDIEAFAQSTSAPILACEVNVRPRNEVSLAFHAAQGFEEVGRQDTEGGTKTVAMMTRPVAQDTRPQGDLASGPGDA